MRRDRPRPAADGAPVLDLSEARVTRRPPAGPERAAPEPVAAPLAAADAVAAHLARVHDEGYGAVSVSWVNHHSAQAIVRRAPDVLQRMTYLGVDGLLLRRLLGGTSPRTSADSVIPALLARLDSPRVAIVGGSTESLSGAARAVEALLPPGGRIVAVQDGYDDLPRGRDLDAWLARTRPTVVLAGLGAPLQDEFVLEVARRLPTGLALTCGGFLDQVQQEDYYPSWAYPLKLNWLVRLVKEPRRLWRRYTVDAVTALAMRSTLRRHVLAAEGVRRLRLFALPPRERRRATPSAR